jgi:hypothetical protein
MLDRQSIIEGGEKNGLRFIGSVEDCTTPESQDALDEFEAKVIALSGMIHLVKVGKQEYVFSGENINGSRFIHGLAKGKKAVA